MNRRTALKATLAAPLAMVAVTNAEAEAASLEVVRLLDVASSSGVPYAPKFFTAHEWETVRVLVDMIIPRDARSGSATEAGVPEFMDFIVMDQPSRQVPLRGGLAWMDAEARARYGTTFVNATQPQRILILNDIAWPKQAKPEHSHGVTFFTSFRDFTASGFYSSKMGVQDLKYMGNTFVLNWNGCPPEALARFGVSYDG